MSLSRGGAEGEAAKSGELEARCAKRGEPAKLAKGAGTAPLKLKVEGDVDVEAHAADEVGIHVGLIRG